MSSGCWHRLDRQGVAAEPTNVDAGCVLGGVCGSVLLQLVRRHGVALEVLGTAVAATIRRVGPIAAPWRLAAVALGTLPGPLPRTCAVARPRCVTRPRRRAVNPATPGRDTRTAHTAHLIDLDA